MTNEEWIKNLDIKTLARLINLDNCCACCIGCDDNKFDKCEERIIEWLKKDYEEGNNLWNRKEEKTIEK